MRESWREFRTIWKGSDPERKKAILDAMTPDERRRVNWWLVEYARDKQLPPAWDWLYWLLRPGRGFGKTRTGAEWFIERARSMPGSVMGLIGETVADVRMAMIEEGPSAIMQVCPPDFKPVYVPSKRILKFPNGSHALTFSGDKPAQLRGPQFHTVWIDELAKFMYAQEVMDQLEFSLRLAFTMPDGRVIPPQGVITTTPRPIKVIKDLVSDPDVADVTGSMYENVENLSPRKLARLRRKYDGTALGKQELHGEVLEEIKGALWKMGDVNTPGTLEFLRVREHPDLVRIVVSADPPGSTAECGITVVGMDEKETAYLLEDCSLEGSPAEWGAAIVDAYVRWRADLIVGERNQGGEMVGHTIRTVRDEQDRPIGKNLPIKLVWASKGKHTRAEPISSLYSQGRARHVGNGFGELEGQMTTWLPGQKSPDRMDALVWGMTELFAIELEEQQEEAAGEMLDVDLKHYKSSRRERHGMYGDSWRENRGRVGRRN